MVLFNTPAEIYVCSARCTCRPLSQAIARYFSGRRLPFSRHVIRFLLVRLSPVTRARWWFVPKVCGRGGLSMISWRVRIRLCRRTQHRQIFSSGRTASTASRYVSVEYTSSWPCTCTVRISGCCDGICRLDVRLQSRDSRNVHRACCTLG